MAEESFYRNEILLGAHFGSFALACLAGVGPSLLGGEAIDDNVDSEDTDSGKEKVKNKMYFSKENSNNESATPNENQDIK